MTTRPAALVRPATFVVLIGIASAVIGFGREIAISIGFGASSQADAFYTALFIPTLLYNLLIVGTLGSAIVPTLARLDESGDLRAFRSVFAGILFPTLAVLVLLGIAGSLAAPVVTAVVGPALPATTAARTAQLIRVLIWLVPLFGAAGLLGAALNARRLFVVVAIGPALFSLGIITLVAIGHRSHSITWAATGAMIGAGAQVIILAVYAAISGGLRGRYHLDWQHPAVREVLVLAAPVFGSLAIGQVGLLVERILASTLPVGSIASLNFAQRLIQIPASVVVAGVATVLLPYLARTTRQRTLLEPALRTTVFIMAPLVVFIALFASPLVQLLFQHGAFTARASSTTAAAASLYIIGQLPYSVALVATRSLYASGGGRAALNNAAVYVGANVVFDLVLVRPLHLNGLALGSSLGAIVGLIAVLNSIARREEGLRMWSVARSWSAPVVAALAAGLSTYGLASWATHGFLVSGGVKLVVTLAGAALTEGVFVGLAMAMHLPEGRWLAGAFRGWRARDRDPSLSSVASGQP